MAADVQPLAVLIAAVAGFAASGAWYHVLGNSWLAASRIGTAAARQDARKPQRTSAPIVVTFLAELLMALVLAFILPAGEWQIGATAGAVVWLGFVLPATAINYTFQKRPLSLLLIDGGHWLLVLALMGGLLGLMSS
jgi:hypothetical protein